MNTLRIEQDNLPASLSLETVLTELQHTGFRYASTAIEKIDANTPDDEVIEAYREQIELFMNNYGYEFIEVIKLSTVSSSDGAYVYKHESDQFETRLITHGQCSLFLRFQGRTVELKCRAGDILHIPSSLCYWLEGEMRDSRYIHLYMTANGWDKTTVRQDLQPCITRGLRQAS